MNSNCRVLFSTKTANFFDFPFSAREPHVDQRGSAVPLFAEHPHALPILCCLLALVEEDASSASLRRETSSPWSRASDPVKRSPRPATASTGC